MIYPLYIYVSRMLEFTFKPAQLGSVNDQIWWYSTLVHSPWSRPQQNRFSRIFLHLFPLIENLKKLYIITILLVVNENTGKIIYLSIINLMQSSGTNLIYITSNKFSLSNDYSNVIECLNLFMVIKAEIQVRLSNHWFKINVMLITLTFKLRHVLHQVIVKLQMNEF